MRFFKITTIFIFSLLAACASGPKFSTPTPPKEGMSVVYVYRPWTYANGAASPIIQLDGSGEDKLINGSYLRFETPPGKHKIAIAQRFDFMISRTWPGTSMEISTEPNKEYYVRYSTAADVIPTGVFTIIQFEFAFQLVPPDIALKELTSAAK